MTITLVPFAPIIESRATICLRNPRSISTDIHAAAGGLAVHYGGDAQQIPSGDAHTRCRARVCGWQSYHMDDRGWVDIAYNWVVCQHGVLMVGRGFGVRSAANGTDDANSRYLACCWLGGGAETPTTQAVATIEWLIGEIRRRGAGKDVQPHRHFFSTDCPGDVLTGAAGTWRTATILEPGAKPTPSGRPPAVPSFPLAKGQYFGPRDGGPDSISGFYGHRSDLARWQARAGGLVPDGLYGSRTASRVRAVQTIRHLAVDGLIGPLTWRATWS